MCFIFIHSLLQKGKEFDTDKGIMDLKNSTLAFSNDSKKLLGVLPNGTFIWNVKGNSCKCIGHPLSLNCMNAISVCSPKLDYIVPLDECKKIEVIFIACLVVFILITQVCWL